MNRAKESSCDGYESHSDRIRRQQADEQLEEWERNVDSSFRCRSDARGRRARKRSHGGRQRQASAKGSRSKA